MVLQKELHNIRRRSNIKAVWVTVSNSLACLAFLLGGCATNIRGPIDVAEPPHSLNGATIYQLPVVALGTGSYEWSFSGLPSGMYFVMYVSSDIESAKVPGFVKLTSTLRISDDRTVVCDLVCDGDHRLAAKDITIMSTGEYPLVFYQQKSLFEIHSTRNYTVKLSTKNEEGAVGSLRVVLFRQLPVSSL